MDNSQNTLDKVIAWFFICIILLIVGYGTYDIFKHAHGWEFLLLVIVYIWVFIRIEEIYNAHIKKT